MSEGAESQSKQAFLELLDTLRSIADRYAGEEWMISGPEDVGGALRSLGHLIEGGFVGHFEGTAEAPVWRAIVTSTRKALGDNADALYFDTPISGAHAYRVTGNLDGAVYTSFTIEEGGGDGGFPDRTGGVFNDTHFDVDADGNYEIFLGGAAARAQLDGAHPGRDAHHDAALLGGALAARRDARARPGAHHRGARRRRTAAGPDRRVGRRGLPSGHQLRACPHRRHGTTHAGRPARVRVARSRTRSRHRCRRPTTRWPRSTRRIRWRPYVLGPDEALVMTARWPDCRCASVSLWNRHMQTYDYVHRSVALNRAQTVLDADGSFRAVIAHRDPGVPNWLDTEGRPFGLVFWRYFLPEGPIATPTAEVVPVDSLG